MSEEKLEVQLCCQCGSMKWTVLSDSYAGSHWVRDDGHVEFEENFEKVEYVCSECGAWTLLGIVGAPETLRKLVKLDPMERILRTLKYLVEDKLEQTDEDVGPDDVLEWIEEYFKDRWKMLYKGEGDVEGFLSKARGIIARWKLLDEP
jgi:hypothetical protein